MGRKKGGVVVTSVSIPIHLKKRMDIVGESVNWSSVACKAFEKKLIEVAGYPERKKWVLTCLNALLEVATANDLSEDVVMVLCATIAAWEKVPDPEP